MELELDIDLSQIEKELEKLDDIKKELSSLKEGQGDQKDKAMKDLVVVMDSLQGIFKTPLSIDKVNLEGLDTLKKELVSVQKAIKGIKIPKTVIPKNDYSKLEKTFKEELGRLGVLITQKSNDAHVMIDNFDEMPVSLDNGVTTVNGVTVPAPVETNYETRIQEDSVDPNVSYIGKAAIDSETSGSVWQIQKIDENTGLVVEWADGNDSFDNIFDNRESISYS